METIQKFIELPEELKTLLAVLVTVVVTQFLKWLSGKLNQDLSGYTAQVTASIVGAILVLVNAIFSNVPAEFAPVVMQLLGLVVVLLGAFGFYDKFLKEKPKG